MHTANSIRTAGLLRRSFASQRGLPRWDGRKLGHAEIIGVIGDGAHFTRKVASIMALAARETSDAESFLVAYRVPTKLQR